MASKHSKTLKIMLITTLSITTLALAAKAAEWKYTGTNGPENWGNLDNKNHACSAGKLQSPFDIKADIDAKLLPIDFTYGALPISVVNNGHTLQVNTIDNSNKIEVSGHTFALKQFHFHTPSEYTIDGKEFPMELHFVHASDEGNFAVIGVMMEEGEANPTIDALWESAPAEKGEKTTEGAKFDLVSLLPEQHNYLRFMGSLTTPPCTEGINWHMLQTPITVSKAQIEKFKTIFPHNARPLQPENNRLVVKGS